MRARRACLGLALVLVGLRVSGQGRELVEEERIRIGLGRAEEEVGVDRDGGR